MSALLAGPPSNRATESDAAVISNFCRSGDWYLESSEFPYGFESRDSQKSSRDRVFR
jgi:hypothetical protein